MRRLHRQQGVALLFVLVLLASAAFLATSQLIAQQRNIQLATQRAAESQALWYALAAEEWAKLILQQDRKDNATDSLDDIWATALPPIELPRGGMSASLQDYQARLNVNALRESSGVPALTEQRLRKLFELFEVDPDRVQAVMDWVDQDRQAKGFAGAEDDYYSRLQPGYLPPNAALGHVAEVRLIKGVDEALFERLSPQLAAMPEQAGLNVTTAGPEVLLALGLSESQVELLLNERQREAFGSIDDLIQRVAITDQRFTAEGIGVQSDHFLLSVEVVVDDQRYVQQSLISRAQNRVLWRVQQAPNANLESAEEEPL